jgi:hypothetical protein
MKFKRGKLYCISNPLWDYNIYKLGNTGQTIKSRVSTIQTSLYLDCVIEYETEELVCCKYYEKLLETILSKYRVNPKREFYYVSKEDIIMIFNFFSELNKMFNTEEKLLKYIQENNPEYHKVRKDLPSKMALCSNTAKPLWKRIYKSDSSSDEKPRRKKGIYVDTTY